MRLLKDLDMQYLVQSRLTCNAGITSFDLHTDCLITKSTNMGLLISPNARKSVPKTENNKKEIEKTLKSRESGYDYCGGTFFHF